MNQLGHWLLRKLPAQQWRRSKHGLIGQNTWHTQAVNTSDIQALAPSTHIPRFAAVTNSSKRSKDGDCAKVGYLSMAARICRRNWIVSSPAASDSNVQMRNQLSGVDERGHVARVGRVEVHRGPGVDTARQESAQRLTPRALGGGRMTRTRARRRSVSCSASQQTT